MNKAFKLITLLVFASIFSSCLKITEMYIGLNLQPDMKNSPFEPGLNVFGVLKTGPDFDTVNHRFEVHQLLDLLNWDESFEVNNAEIVLVRNTTNGIESMYKPSHYSNGLYFDNHIVTAPGDRWEFTCAFDTFLVSATCIIPQTPVIDDQNYSLTNNEVSFSIVADSSAYMYIAYAFQGENFISTFSVPDRINPTSIVFKPDWTINNEGMLVYVFALDKNLRQYYTTSNTFFKPNAYRPLFTTVEGGFGVFGATSSVLVNLP